ncbi:MAG: YceI family protein [Aggregatilineales bacterium]
MTRNRLIALIVAVIAVVAAIGIMTAITLANTKSVNEGTTLSAPTVALPLDTNGSKPSGSHPQPISVAQAVMDIHPIAQSNPTGTAAPLYVSCTVLRGSTPTPTGAAPASAATTAATMAATIPVAAATAVPTAVAADFTIYQIAGAESEACYQVGESLPGKGEPFNLAIGVTTAIAGQIAVDSKNLAASKIGQIVIDISKFQSDQSMRDGFIRRQFLESNTYPLAKFTPTQIIGLPARAYVPGETLTFQIVGTLNVHNTDHPETLNVSAQLVDTNTLVSIATTDILMTDFNVSPPTIAGFVTANNQTHLILNLVAHPVKQ